MGYLISLLAILMLTIVLINKTYNKENKSDKEEIKTENKE